MSLLVATGRTSNNKTLYHYPLSNVQGLVNQSSRTSTFLEVNNTGYSEERFTY